MMNRKEKENILANVETICADIYDVDELRLALEQIGLASSNMLEDLVDSLDFYRKQVDKSIIEIQSLLSKISKARNKIKSMFDNGNENTIIDDLLELDKILGDVEDE